MKSRQGDRTKTDGQ